MPPTATSAEIHAALIAGLENGALNPVIGKELPLADAPRAHDAVMQTRCSGKIVLVVWFSSFEESSVIE